MLKLTDRAAVRAVLTDPDIDPELRALIGLRAWQLDDVRHQPLGETVQFVVVHPGDLADSIHEAVGFPICCDEDDGPGFEWLEAHPGWFEIAIVLTDALGLLVFVADHDDTDPGLRSRCLAAAVDRIVVGI